MQPMEFLGWSTAGLFLISSALSGVFLLRSVGSRYLSRFEMLAFGPPLGLVVFSLLLLLLATLLGFSTNLIYVFVLFVTTAAYFLWKAQHEGASTDRQEMSFAFLGRNRAGMVLFILFIVIWGVVYANAYTFDERGVSARTISLWADWALHLGDTMYLAEGHLPPENPRYPGQPYAYHYLTSFTSAVMVKLGMSGFTALPLLSFFLSCFVAFSIYAFFRRLTGDDATSAVGVALFLLAGGIGWYLVLRHAATSADFFAALRNQPWNVMVQESANYRLHNMYYSLIHPQRGYLYGLPLAMLVFTFLLGGIESGSRRPFIYGGLVAGLLPFAHLSTLLSLGLIIPFLVMLFWSPLWSWFFGVWMALAVPQLLFQQGGASAGAATLRWQPGWVAPPDPWIWFWLKNLGLFLPILLFALFQNGLFPPRSKRFLLAFMPVFLIGNLVVFQPWDWDNTKILLYWMLAACVFVAAFFVRTWRTHSSAALRLLMMTAFVSIVLAGVLVNANHLLGRETQFLLTADELKLAQTVRRVTGPGSILAVGLQHNHPVPMLTGRRVLMSYTGWLWSQGIDSSERERDLRSMFRMEQNAGELFRRHGIDYVVIGPYEMTQLRAAIDDYRRQFPRVVQVGPYEVFDVRAR